jgi:nitrogen regulatory protein P-II 1
VYLRVLKHLTYTLTHYQIGYDLVIVTKSFNKREIYYCTVSELKRIEAIVPHGRLDRTFEGLKQLELGGFTYYESKGRGQAPRPQVHSGRGTTSYTPAFNANALIVLVVNDSMVDKVAENILSSSSTGMAGEGKMFISQVDDAVDIGTRTKGESAI